MTRKQGASQRDTTPQSFPEVTPRAVQHGHDFQLQIIMELQRSIGDLSAKTDRLIADVKSQSDKVDKLRMRFAWVTGAAAVIGFLLAVIMAVARFLPANLFSAG